MAFRAGLSGFLLAGLSWWLDFAQLISRLTEMRLGWISSVLALSIFQVLVSAWRWRFTAERLGLELSFGKAVREYYLAMFINQVLPGGVLGDVSRAWRHRYSQPRMTQSAGSPISAVVIERLSGQLVMVTIAFVSLMAFRFSAGVVVLAVILVWLVIVVGIKRWAKSFSSNDSYSLRQRLWRDAKSCLFSSGAFPFQAVSSILVVGTYIATYVMAAMAVGIDTPMQTLLPLVAPVLVSMLLPISVAGWGVREAVAALVWGSVGLAEEEGVAISLAYGLCVFVAALPGCLVVIQNIMKKSGRTVGSAH